MHDVSASCYSQPFYMHMQRATQDKVQLCACMCMLYVWSIDSHVGAWKKRSKVYTVGPNSLKGDYTGKRYWAKLN